VPLSSTVPLSVWPASAAAPASASSLLLQAEKNAGAPSRTATITNPKILNFIAPLLLCE
jgi:hypothetical protein